MTVVPLLGLQRLSGTLPSPNYMIMVPGLVLKVMVVVWN